MWQAKSTFTSPQLNKVIKHAGYDFKETSRCV